MYDHVLLLGETPLDTTTATYLRQTAVTSIVFIS